MEKEELLKETHIYDCASDVGEEGWWCLDHQRFANTDVALGFLVVIDSLVAVSVYRGFSEESFSNIFSAVSSRLRLIGMYSKEGVLDFLLLGKSIGKEGLIREVGNFERRALNVGSLTYMFVDGDLAPKLIQEANSLAELHMAMDENTRTAELAVWEDEFGQAYITLRFDIPKLYNKLRLGDRLEDF